MAPCVLGTGQGRAPTRGSLATYIGTCERKRSDTVLVGGVRDVSPTGGARDLTQSGTVKPHGQRAQPRALHPPPTPRSTTNEHESSDLWPNPLRSRRTTPHPQQPEAAPTMPEDEDRPLDLQWAHFLFDCWVVAVEFEPDTTQAPSPN